MTGDGLRFAVRGAELAALAALDALEHGWQRRARAAGDRRRAEFAAKWRFNRLLRSLVDLAGGRRRGIVGRAPRAGRSARRDRVRRRCRVRLKPIALLAIVFVPMLVEARRADRNERVQRARGGIEPPGDVYDVMRIAYPAVFLAMIAEGAWRSAPARRSALDSAFAGVRPVSAHRVCSPRESAQVVGHRVARARRGRFA